MPMLTLLPSLLPFAFCALFMVALALFVGFLFWRFFSRAKVVPKVDGEALLTKARAQPLPWSREAFTDLSNRCKADWRPSEGVGTSRALCKASAVPTRPGWLTI